MLAQNFKTPADLGITDAEFDALAKVLRMLEREELKHADPRTPVPLGFNMNRMCVKTSCGTVACLFGWAKIVADDWTLFERSVFSTRHANVHLLETFMFQNMGRVTYAQDWDRHKVTPAQAAIALRNFLTHGEPRWNEALAT